jgi:hypothetical protein
VCASARGVCATARGVCATARGVCATARGVCVCIYINDKKCTLHVQSNRIIES